MTTFFERVLRSLASKMMRPFGFKIIETERLEALQSEIKLLEGEIASKNDPQSAIREARLRRVEQRKVDFIFGISPEFGTEILTYFPNSYAQLYQDLFVLSETGFKKDGYFVEFGATNGISLSNTYLLEGEFGWSGILAEPARPWHDALQSNRSAKVDFRCVWRETGEMLEFSESDVGEYSTLGAFAHLERHTKNRIVANRYDVPTVSLLDLLKDHNAPRLIDYLSIDTEGSELEILKAFDFDAYDIRIITVEHNHTPDRKHIYKLLTAKGFVRKYEKLSKFDDWYVKP
ncbi:MAG: FkbM family methyltransferase [Pseudomonadota bacterium]